MARSEKTEELIRIVRALREKPRLRTFLASADGLARVENVFGLHDQVADGVARGKRPPDISKRRHGDPNRLTGG